ncbi:hypothetical protein [Mesobacillus jeotgali]|uniref:hypothetical protein n=1 Tax=Mesobacillus jeotgali TaxID=129985 RepID=UPI001781BAEF|nr:hypothetical protein [Mesobacillus jeotgali]UYZ24008.1 hypothetical protein FOF60_10930 [Mesobacillus jeotgali]
MPGDKIIRWGIPGWILMAWLLSLYTVTHQEQVLDFLKNEAVKSLSITAILGSIGVPLGYLIHELYFAMSWTIIKIDINKIILKVENFPYLKNWNSLNDKEKYYYFEYIWDKNINRLEEGLRKEMKERYRDRLTLIHSLGTLFFSMLLTIVASITGIVLELGLTIITSLVMLFQIITVLILWKNYKYHSDQLKDYQGYFLNDMINNKLNI